MINKNKKLVILILMVMTVMVKTQNTTNTTTVSRRRANRQTTKVCELTTNCRDTATKQPITLPVSGLRGPPGPDGQKGETGADGLPGLPGMNAHQTLIAFFVQLTEEKKEVKENIDVIFDKVHLNEGSGYSAKTGRFTVPESGVYQFKFSVQDTGGPEHGQAIIQLTRVSISTGEQKMIIAARADPRPAANTAIVECVAGDEVWLVLLGGDNYQLEGSTITAFSGMMIFPD